MRPSPQFIPAERWFNMINSLRSLCHICRYCQFKSVFSTAQQITHSFKHLTLAGYDCQLRRLVSLSVYQSVSTSLLFISFPAGQNNPKGALFTPDQDSQCLKRRVLGMLHRKCINIPHLTFNWQFVKVQPDTPIS